jgi:hypothetical protein
VAPALLMDRTARFREANRLWYDEGRTRRAIDAYRALVDEDPDDPLALQQLSLVTWATDDFDAARRLAARADQNRHRLDARAAERLDWWLEDLALSTPHRDVPFGVDNLDMDVIERMDEDAVPWDDVAGAAQERRMLGLARIAADQALGTFADAEDFREVDAIERAAARARRLLERSLGPSGEEAEEPPASPEDLHHADLPASAPSPAIGAGGEERAPDRDLAAADAVLALEAGVVPETAPPHVSVQLVVRLRNLSAEPALVNGRLLLVPRGKPAPFGELTLRVRGPTGYRNSIAFMVRSGEPDADDFVVLEPGASLDRSIPLSRYQTLHLPGRYDLTVTYRNAVPHRRGAQQAIVGEATAVATFTRTGA